MTDALFFRALGDGLSTLGVSPGVRLSDLPVGFAPLVGVSLRHKSDLPLVVVVPGDGPAVVYRDALSMVVGRDSVLFCPGVARREEGAPPGFSSPLEVQRKIAWSRLASGDLPEVLIVTADVFDEGLPEGAALLSTMLDLAVGKVEYEALRDWLELSGYEPVTLVTEPGTYAHRGGVVDVFPVNRASPVRLDFYGEDLEGVRDFDIHTQMSTGPSGSVKVLPAQEVTPPRKPVLDLFPAGWLMLQSDGGDSWLFTSNAQTTETKSVSLSVVDESGGRQTAETIDARWTLFQSATGAGQAWYATEREQDLARAASRLGSVPMGLMGAPVSASYSSIPLNVFLVSPADLFHQHVGTNYSGPASAPSVANIQKHVEALDFGDPLIHVNHGVGLYSGMTTLEVGGRDEECLVLEYGSGGKVYVSTDKINLVHPYTVHEGQKVSVDSLSSKRWERVKRQTRRSAEEIVEQLALLYAERAEAVGVQHPVDDDFQYELEATFPHKETVDQLRAIADIKADMEGIRPMDRLLCGDVGFGKTEVALRAIFKALRGGGQVALLAPTTILADQHLISFKARMEPFAVNIALLSRFVTAAEQKKTLKKLASGEVDLVIGTHRLLSKDVQFKNLNLLVVDEEHRFGVKQKERVKELKTNLDVLSLTATPIPRTLHFSLAGIRDISRLDTPPLERIPIMTSIAYYDDTLIVESVRREISRGGQVYFVHNEVQSIARIARELQDLLPGVSMAIAHGQMDGKTLEQTMLGFADGQFQVLICTSIIESGIDLPNVNTVLINNANHFGLAQIYQIRGRVGRSSRQGYALLLVRRRPKLSIVAMKRLKTIERYSALGSGYAIALKDLEIRGAGNVFGMEQSGHIAAVGLDLYTKIVRGVLQERAEAAGDAVPVLPSEEVTIKILPGSALPQDYISDPHLRLNLYRRFAAVETVAEVTALEAELADRFGPPPEELSKLLLEVALRVRARLAGVRAVRLAAGPSVAIDFAILSNPSELIETIGSVLQPRNLDYKFKNLKRGDLQLIIFVDPSKSYDTATALLDALIGESVA